MMKSIKNILIVLIFLTILFITGCQGSAEVSREEKTKKVEVLTLAQEKKPVTLEYIGHVHVKEEREIAFLNGGEILLLNKSVGDSVKKGELLATLNKGLIHSDQQSALDQYKRTQNAVLEAKERLNFAKDQYFKIQRLYESDAIAKTKLEEAKLNFDTSKLKYNQVQNSLSSAKNQYQKITDSVDQYNAYADINGSVISVMNETGEKVQPMQPFMIIASHEKEINTAVTREDLEKITLGSSVKVIYQSETIVGEIKNIARKMDKVTKTYPITISLEKESKDLINESLVNVKFEIGSTQGIWIPLDAVIVDIESFVFLHKNGIADKVRIDLIDSDGELVQVEGLKGKESLVVKGMSSLRDGDSIELVK